MPPTTASPPALSIVLTVVSGAESVRRSLAALGAERALPGVEILVPIERDRPQVRAVVREFPGATALDLGELPLIERRPGPAQEHERYDRRRAAGLRAATGSILAILEDHGTPDPGWAAAVLSAHQRLPHAAIGGVVGNAVARSWNIALWLCDFHRYAAPRPAGPAATLTDVNVSYKRGPLLAVETTWRERYHEPLVHAALLARGETLWLDPSLLVRQERPAAGAGSRLGERFAWGFLYGTLRGAALPRYKRVLFGTASLLLPPLLLWRILRSAWGRLPLLRTLSVLPHLGLLLVAWCLGEAAGTWRSSRRDSGP